MRGWVPRLRHCLKRPHLQRTITTHSHERVKVRCGSAGEVAIDLFNLSKFSETSPLLIHLPPFSPEQEQEDKIPSIQEFLHNWPVASINYRWRKSDGMPTQQWPNPCHDVGFAFSWLRENLSPPSPARRSVYVYGSYLGASLAASLALTESFPHERFGIRGLVAYNGVYNWTMFLPKHPIRRNIQEDRLAIIEGQHLRELGLMQRDLFGEPSRMFDPFASAGLLFHSPALYVPDGFGKDASPVSNTISMFLTSSSDGSVSSTIKQPRKSSWLFPSRSSTLKIPPTLLLYNSPGAPPWQRFFSKKPLGHSFFAQAHELAYYMGRSLANVEFKERVKWDDEIEIWEAEARTRVQLSMLGHEREQKDLCSEGAGIVRGWLEDRTSK